VKNFNPISILAFFIVLYVARNAIPYAIYLLIPLLFLFTLYQLVNIKEAKQSFVRSVKMFFPVILLILIELIALFCTAYPFKGLPLNFLKEIAFTSVFLFLLAHNVRSKHDFMLLIEKIGKYFIFFAIIASLLGLWKFFYSPPIISYRYIDEIRYFRWGTTLVSDYNFFSLFLLNGLAFGLYMLLRSPEKIKYKTWLLVALQLFILVGLLSGSRRFIFCLGIFFIVCLLLLIPFLFKKAFANELSYKTLLLFLTLSVFNFGIIFSFLSYFPLISEKAEKIFFINSHKTNLNIKLISSRVNSAASFRLIKVHVDKQISTPEEDLEKEVDDETITELQITSLKEKDIVSVTSSRKKLWVLGKKIFDEYAVVHKIFGDGFTFLKIFQKETERYFYPHHLFLSVLLFSGVMGLIIYIAVLLWSSIIYLFHLKKLGILFFLFIINFIFGFFSFTDFLGASFYALLFIFPFLYHYLHKKARKHEGTKARSLSRFRAFAPSTSIL